MKLHLLGLLCLATSSLNTLHAAPFTTEDIPSQGILAAMKKLQPVQGPAYVAEGFIQCTGTFEGTALRDTSCSVLIEAGKPQKLSKDVKTIIAIIRKKLETSPDPEAKYWSFFSPVRVSAAYSQRAPYQLQHSKATLLVSQEAPAEPLFKTARQLKRQAGPAYHFEGMLWCEDDTAETQGFCELTEKETRNALLLEDYKPVLAALKQSKLLPTSDGTARSSYAMPVFLSSLSSCFPPYQTHEHASFQLAFFP